MTSSQNRKQGRGVLVFRRSGLPEDPSYGGWVYTRYGDIVGLPNTVGPFESEHLANEDAAKWLMERREKPKKLPRKERAAKKKAATNKQRGY